MATKRRQHEVSALNAALMFLLLLMWFVQTFGQIVEFGNTVSETPIKPLYLKMRQRHEETL